MTIPRVTVGIPVYNGGKYIAETIESLLAQTMGDFELLVCDNASTDGTAEIVNSHAARDPRIRVLRSEENLGAAFNYNECVARARAPLFKWNAADDLCCPRVLEVCVDELDAHPNAVVAYPLTRIIDGAGLELKEYDDRLDMRQDNPAHRFAASIELIGECNAVFGVMRTAVLRRTARIGPYPGSDVVLVTELALYGGFHRLSSATFFRRDHAAASSAAGNRTVEYTLAFYDPKKPKRKWMRAWRHLCERWRAIRRAPMTAWERWQCIRWLLREAVIDRSKLWSELMDPSGKKQSHVGGAA